MSKKKITLVTGNAGKLMEFIQIFQDPYFCEKDGVIEFGNFQIVTKSLDIQEIQGSIDEIITYKAKKASEIINGPVIVDDTSLCFNAFEGLPGPYIKWFVKSLSLENVYNMLFKFEDKSAKAYCTIGYCEGLGKDVKIFQGITEGTIVSPKGSQLFGWDPIFKPKSHEQTYAEMGEKKKNEISHRNKAIKKLKEYLKGL